MSGHLVEIRIDAPAECAVARASETAGVGSTALTKTVRSGEDGVTEEFVLNAGEDLDGELERVDESLREVFSYASGTVYRFDREPGCPCDCIEQFDCPVVDVSSRDGELLISFHVSDMETFRRTMATLTEQWPETTVHRIVRPDEREGDSGVVVLDRNELTERQREVLTTAREMGYFEYPKRANASEVAEELGVDVSTVTEHIARAQQKLLASVL